jgi:CRP-like cAMP-binding protein
MYNNAGIAVMSDHKELAPLADIDEVLSILKQISILAGLSGEQLHSVCGLLNKVSYEAGETIFEKGDRPSYIYIIKKGRVKLHVCKDSKILDLVEFGEGQCLGEASVIGIQPHSVSAVAVEDTELIVLSRTMLMSIYESDTNLFSILILNIAREVCRRLHSASETLLLYEHTQK